MHELSLLAAASDHPARDCVIAEEQAFSYAEVGARVRQAVSSLRARGVERGDRVALTPLIDVESLVRLYALFEIGCPAVLLHPRLTDRERSAILDRVAPVRVVSGPIEHHATPAVESLAQPLPDQTLAIVFTSGSCGTPRGVRLSRRAFIASEAAHAAHLGWRSGDRWLLALSLAHVGGLSIVTRSLIARRCIVLGSPAFEPDVVARALHRDRVTICSFVPTMLRRMLSLEPAWVPAPELRAVLVGGAHFSESLQALAIERCVPALATYGCTEACSQVTTQSPAQCGTPGSGGPLPGIQVRIEDGEIQVGGPVLMDGYLEDEGISSWQTPDGWLRTGDLGSFLPDGQLAVHGRLDDMIVTGGENVSPQEVESWLQTVPGIEGACVFSLPSDEWGEEVVAAVVSDTRAYDASVLRERLTEELAPHKRPKRVCMLDALPLNRSGKVDRAAVRERCAELLRPT
jgi:O-succinylbenzoic acid--CoA ligase